MTVIQNKLSQSFSQLWTAISGMCQPKTDPDTLALLRTSNARHAVRTKVFRTPKLRTQEFRTRIFRTQSFFFCSSRPKGFSINTWKMFIETTIRPRFSRFLNMYGYGWLLFWINYRSTFPVAAPPPPLYIRHWLQRRYPVEVARYITSKSTQIIYIYNVNILWYPCNPLDNTYHNNGTCLSENVFK